MKLFKTKNMLIQSLKGVKNSLEKKNKMYENDIIILLDSSKELREEIRNLENNLEFVTNNLSAQKKKKIGL